MSHNRIRLAGAAVMLAGAATLWAQARPDFSGQWTTDPDPAAAAASPAAGAPAGRGGRAGRGGGGRSGDMGTGWGSTITLTQDATSLTLQYAFFTRGDMQPPLRFVFALDGSASTNTVMMGRGMQREVSRAVWDGQALVITTTHNFVDPATGRPAPAVVIRRLALDGGALIVDTTRKGVLGGADTNTRASYRRIGGT